MFLIVAAGLGVASLLYRVVTAAARRRQNSIDHLEADGIGDQNARDNQQQYRSVDERDQFVDDLHSSTIAAANDRDDQQHHRSVDDRDRLIEDLHRSQISGETIAMIRNTIDLSMIAIRSSMICTAHLYRAQTIMTPVAHTQPMTIGQTIHAAPAGPVISPTT